MGRNLYILAATLMLFALVSGIISFTNIAQQPGSPGDVTLWRMTGLAFMLVSLVILLVGMLSSLFEQAERKADEARRLERETRHRRRPSA